jgi:hypothetical protein
VANLRAAANALRRPPAVQARKPADAALARRMLESAFHLQQSGRLTDAIPLFDAPLHWIRTQMSRTTSWAARCAAKVNSPKARPISEALELNASNIEACNNVANVRKELGDSVAAEPLLSANA